jgi:UDP-GlcNAc:undecaprenyl-phosphate GlcNAc-1-phosphate transferase
MYIESLFFLLGLFISEILYLKIADRFSIIDKPNERSSHVLPTIRGGGIIFILAATAFSIYNNLCYPFLVAGLLVTGMVSFYDDVRGLPRRLRFATHFLGVILLLIQVDLIELSWVLIPLFILLIGILNAYNFMDGINGITGFYSLAVLFPFWWFEKDAQLHGFIGVILLSLIVFLFFNARKRAKCFAGDIGSIGMALIVLFVILQKIIETGNWLYIFSLLIYGIDSIFTICQRLILGENIFDAHRKHLYQILANEFKLPHLLVSLIFAILQLGISEWLFNSLPTFEKAILVAIIIGIFYIAIKYFLLHKLKARRLIYFNTSL